MRRAAISLEVLLLVVLDSVIGASMLSDSKVCGFIFSLVPAADALA